MLLRPVTASNGHKLITSPIREGAREPLIDRPRRTAGRRRALFFLKDCQWSFNPVSRYCVIRCLAYIGYRTLSSGSSNAK
jgi:hypothetical protein